MRRTERMRLVPMALSLKQQRHTKNVAPKGQKTEMKPRRREETQRREKQSAMLNSHWTFNRDSVGGRPVQYKRQGTHTELSARRPTHNSESRIRSNERCCRQKGNVFIITQFTPNVPSPKRGRTLKKTSHD